MCTNGACVAPACNDGVKNGGETDRDCGGFTSCPRCGTGLGCGIPGDCSSGVCGVTNACAAPACNDGVKNGTETAMDCGGTCPSTCGLGQACLVSSDCTSRFCGSLTCATAKGCNQLLSSGGAPDSGVYSIDPDGAGGNGPFDVWCDMSLHHGGWALFGKLGESTPSTAKGAFDADRTVASLTVGAVPSSTEFSTWNLSRFDGLGSAWTIRTATDAANDQSHFQYTFYRPAAAATVLPSTAGSNWVASPTMPANLLYLVMSSTSGLANTTWLTPTYQPAVGWEVVGVSIATLGYRRGDFGGGQCLDAAGQTQLCHAPSGAIQNQSGLTGTFTSAFGDADGVAHAHGRKGTYWIKDANAGGTP